MNPSRILLTIVPACFIITVSYMAIFGQKGIIRRYQLNSDLERIERQLSVVQTENARLQWEILQLKESDTNRMRAAAEEMLLVPPGSTVVRFQTEQ